MAEEPIASGKDQGERSEAEPNSVFSNLPASRPGTRSPRRDGAKAAKAEAAPKRERSTESQAAPPAGTGPRSDPEPQPQTQSEPPSQSEPSGTGGLEDIAWAGVAVAAEAATLGVRLATKAFEALRQGADHR